MQVDFLMMTRDKVYESDGYGNAEIKNNLAEKWIESRFNNTIKEIELYLNLYRLNDYTKSLYSFVWNDFCDWYIELIKSKINTNPESAKLIVDDALRMYEKVLILLHPVIPYVTEEIWHILDENREGKSISFEKFPLLNKELINDEIEISFEHLKDLVTTTRNVRSLYVGINNYKFDIHIKPLNSTSEGILPSITELLQQLVNHSNKVVNEKDVREFKGTSGNHFAVKFEFLGEMPQLKNAGNSDKVNKEIDSLKSYINGLKKKLTNQNFLDKAAPDVIEKEQTKLKESEEKLEKLKNMS